MSPELILVAITLLACGLGVALLKYWELY